MKDLGELLLTVEKPGRYTGGEYGRLAKRMPRDSPPQLNMLIAFPDLYEIGMSNQAFRIIYNTLNSFSGISCDRTFAPAPDFEELLRSRNIPLYGLDTGISLGSLDVLMFTLGYELGITGVLTMLDRSFIPLKRTERREGDPIVIMGGPCVSNPLPYERFIDAFWIGEAEAGFFDLAVELRDMKLAGALRGELLRKLHTHPSIWTGGKKRANRAMDSLFTSRPPLAAVFPVPSIKIVQHHGAVEIMRGCPNGCRFCHAGVWYRPMRQKNADTIREEAAAFINAGGYREISLSSLSTGDYRHIDSLVGMLNYEYASRHISFQLPSLRVSTFSMPLLEKVSAVRKSGLTFAVETPADAWQLAINKEVSRDTVAAILNEAKRNGWRSAKFYFMVGLPVGENGRKSEEQEIVEFILEIARRTGMNFNINVGTFIPKPHTPYQWAAQIDEKNARTKIEYIRDTLKKRGHRVSYNDPFIAVIEGVLSRGDGRVGELIEEAYVRGCRLDAWDEYIKKDLWTSLLEKNVILVQDIYQARNPEQSLPWDCIHSGASLFFLKREYEKSQRGELTLPCTNNCDNPCGNCNTITNVVYNSIHRDNLLYEKKPLLEKTQKQDPLTLRILFSFEKRDAAIFLSHLAMIEVFSMAFLRANIPILFTQGFNPNPKLDFASPVPLGIKATGEIANIDLNLHEGYDFSAEDFMQRINSCLPEGVIVKEAIKVRIPSGGKKHSIPSLLWGAIYQSLDDASDDFVRAQEEKNYRAALRTISGSPNFYLTRKAVLAKNPNNFNDEVSNHRYDSYFTVYRSLYPE
ncbi:MAG: TIGR03936 family radical SAM-associated protein [Treponema sp.]|nr:TIGR03936 family radical SAM-associated protein [Treponema sp.]